MVSGLPPKIISLKPLLCIYKKNVHFIQLVIHLSRAGARKVVAVLMCRTPLLTMEMTMTYNISMSYIYIYMALLLYEHAILLLFCWFSYFLALIEVTCSPFLFCTLFFCKITCCVLIIILLPVKKKWIWCNPQSLLRKRTANLYKSYIWPT